MNSELKPEDYRLLEIAIKSIEEVKGMYPQVAGSSTLEMAKICIEKVLNPSD